MYIAEGCYVYFRNGETNELFLTAHYTDTGNTMSVEEQARVVAEILNKYG